jgi:hypothetical protein
MAQRMCDTARLRRGMERWGMRPARVMCGPMATTTGAADPADPMCGCQGAGCSRRIAAHVGLRASGYTPAVDIRSGAGTGGKGVSGTDDRFRRPSTRSRKRRTTKTDGPSHHLLLPALLAQHFEVARGCFDAAEEVRQVEFFVGCVQVVVGEPEAHHHTGNAEEPVEHADDRNRSA